jgi:hypothetical protein
MCQIGHFRDANYRCIFIGGCYQGSSGGTLVQVCFVLKGGMPTRRLGSPSQTTPYRKCNSFWLVNIPGNPGIAMTMAALWLHRFVAKDNAHRPGSGFGNFRQKRVMSLSSPWQAPAAVDLTRTASSGS